MDIFVLQNTFIKVYICRFNKYFYKNKKLKLYFEDRVTVLNDMFYEYGGSNWLCMVSHLFFQRKPSANLYACQDQVSCI
jgi:hypothetical protein